MAVLPGDGRHERGDVFSQLMDQPDVIGMQHLRHAGDERGLLRNG